MAITTDKVDHFSEAEIAELVSFSHKAARALVTVLLIGIPLNLLGVPWSKAMLVMFVALSLYSVHLGRRHLERGAVLLAFLSCFVWLSIIPEPKDWWSASLNALAQIHQAVVAQN